MSGDEIRATEVNGNSILMSQIGQLNAMVMESLVFGNYIYATKLLRQYYSLIKPKLVENKKVDVCESIEQKSKRLSLYVLNNWDKNSPMFAIDIQELYEEIHCAADSVGLGITLEKSKRAFNYR